jgi:hypothetical protein
MKQVEYWAAQEESWHKKYLMIEGLCDRLERFSDRLEQRVFDLEQAIRKADKYPMPLECRKMLMAALGGNDER